MGRCYRAFFATLYYAGLRPEKTVALRVGDAALPERGWGEVRVRAARPEVGGRWTDDGAVRESRCLKGRPEGETRVVPLHPELVEILRDLVDAYGLSRGELLFTGERGGPLAGSDYRRVWGKAREAVLPESEFRSSTGRRVADLRDTCLTVWLNSGVPPAQVAEWAGTSVTMLFTAYAQCVSGQAQEVLHRIEAAQALPCVEVDTRQPGVACPKNAAWS
jgi:integrase